MPDVLPLMSPLRFTPTYQVLVWGGRKMALYRHDLPEGPVGESWDLADQDRGMSVVQEGPWKGTTLRELTATRGKDLVGHNFTGGSFPLLVKLIDAAARLSVQVHPDDDLAQAMKLGANGKTECWLMIGDGGELFQGTKANIDQAAFEAALAQGRVEETLNRFETHDGDFFFLPARTVHALGNNCLLYEVQQSSDVTFRVWDWGRVGLDGKPRPLHVKESLETIDFARTGFGAVAAVVKPHARGGLVRALADCAFFSVEERLLDDAQRSTSHAPLGADANVCSIVTCLAGEAELRTQGGAVSLKAMQTVLVPASAGGWEAQAAAAGCRLMHAQPKFAAVP